MNLPWLTSISRMLSQQAASIKGCKGVTSTKTPKYFYTYTTKKKYLVEEFCLAFPSRNTGTSQKMNSRSTWAPDDSRQPKLRAYYYATPKPDWHRGSQPARTTACLPVWASWRHETHVGCPAPGCPAQRDKDIKLGHIILLLWFFPVSPGHFQTQRLTC